MRQAPPRQRARAAQASGTAPPPPTEGAKSQKKKLTGVPLRESLFFPCFFSILVLFLGCVYAFWRILGKSTYLGENGRIEGGTKIADISKIREQAA